MIGAIIGDVVGSRFEFANIKRKDFPLFHKVSTYTDDTVCTIGVAKTLLDNYPIDYSNKGLDKIKEDLISNLEYFVSKYPNSGYGGNFFLWAILKKHDPYNSWGNGSGMRVSSVGWLANTKEEVIKLSKAISEVTHNHPEGIKGAEAIAMSIFMARNGKTKEEIKEYICKNYYPIINDLDYKELVKTYKFDVSCMGSVPHAIYSFLISNDFEDTLKTAISIGGDSDTIACMAGSIAEAYYKDISKTVDQFNKYIKLPEEFISISNRFLDTINNDLYRL